MPVHMHMPATDVNSSCTAQPTHRTGTPPSSPPLGLWSPCLPCVCGRYPSFQASTRGWCMATQQGAACGALCWKHSAWVRGFGGVPGTGDDGGLCGQAHPSDAPAAAVEATQHASLLSCLPLASQHLLPPLHHSPSRPTGNMPDRADAGWLPWLRDQRKKVGGQAGRAAEVEGGGSLLLA